MAAPFQIGPTPNPHSIRVGFGEAMFEKPVTYKAGADAQGQPLVQALLGIPGVTQVFTLNNFLTISKDPAVDWSSIEPRVNEVLAKGLHG